MQNLHIFNSKKMEYNYYSNRKLLHHLGFILIDVDPSTNGGESKEYWKEIINISVLKDSLFLDPIPFFDAIQERISIAKTKMEIKSL